MKRIACVLMLIALLLFSVGIYKAMRLPPSPEPTLRNNYRIIFYHLPSAISSFLAFTVTLIASILFLKTRDVRWDMIAYSSAKFGLFMITAALISGSIWAKVAWGSYWNWDPRETTVLIMWFTYAAYFALRGAIEEYEDKAKYSSAFAILAYATIPLTYLSTRLFFSLHPTSVQIGLRIGVPLAMVMTSFILMYISFLMLDYSISKLEMKIQFAESKP